MHDRMNLERAESMTLLEIHEPGETPLPHAGEGSLAVGIDLGTTNSVVAIGDDSGPPCCRTRTARPRAVGRRLCRGWRRLVGELARRLILDRPEAWSARSSG